MVTWSPLWNPDVAASVVANLYTAAAAFVVFAAVLAWLRLVVRRRVMRFLGVASPQTTVPAHVSYVDPSSFGSGPLEDSPRAAAGEATGVATGEAAGVASLNRFTGPFITQDEVEALAALRLLIEGKVREGPASVRDALRRQTRVRRVRVRLRTEPLPDRVGFRREGLTILLGSGRFNERSRELLASSTSFFRFEYDTRAGYGYSRTFCVNPHRTGAHHDYVPENGRHPDPTRSSELAVVQRIHDPESRSTTLLCCGLSAPATHAAALYLVRQWARLATTFPDAARRDFGVLLRLPEQDKDSVLDPDSPIVVVRTVDGEPIPRSRVTTVLSEGRAEVDVREPEAPTGAGPSAGEGPGRGRRWGRRDGR